MGSLGTLSRSNVSVKAVDLHATIHALEIARLGEHFSDGKLAANIPQAREMADVELCRLQRRIEMERLSIALDSCRARDIHLGLQCMADPSVVRGIVGERSDVVLYLIGPIRSKLQCSITLMFLR